MSQLSRTPTTTTSLAFLSESGHGCCSVPPSLSQSGPQLDQVGWAALCSGAPRAGVCVGQTTRPPLTTGAFAPVLRFFLAGGPRVPYTPAAATLGSQQHTTTKRRP